MVGSRERYVFKAILGSGGLFGSRVLCQCYLGRTGCIRATEHGGDCRRDAVLSSLRDSSQGLVISASLSDLAS